MNSVVIVSSSSDFYCKLIDDLCPRDRTLLLETLHAVLDKGDTIIYVWSGAELKRNTYRLQGLTQKSNIIKGVSNHIDNLDDKGKYIVAYGKVPTLYLLYFRKICSEYNKTGWLKLHYSDTTSISTDYEQFTYTDLGFPEYIGTIDKKKRYCRFCGRSVYEGAKFVGHSHAISYFLGNKHLFCNEECDQCNHNFGVGIEHQLEQYYRPTRNLVGGRSRNNKPLLTRGENFIYDDNKLLIYDDVPDYIKLNGGSLGNYTLVDKEPVIKADVYRALVKFVIACIPGEYLNKFEKTIQWVNGLLKPKLLPKIYRYEKEVPIDRPILNVYIRKTGKKATPYCVAKFRFLSNLYIYALPYCQPYDVGNSMLDQPLRNFVNKHFMDCDYVVESFNNEDESRIFTHIKIETTPDTEVQIIK